ncbi:MAG: hypothetical protein JW791_04510 [Nanoarchaeota archaeon]|nr:hypothetical protein [Nanoarchaeota archaeon]
MKKWFALILLLTFISSGFCFNIQINPVDASVKPGEMVEYNISFSNPSSVEKQVIMFMISDKLNPSFIPGYIVSVPANGFSIIVLKATVSDSAKEGRYYDSVYFDIDGIIQTSQTISYTVEGPEKYFVFNSIDVPSQVDPRQAFNINLNYENGYSDLIQKVYATVEVYALDGTSLYYSLEVVNTPFGNNSVSIPIVLDSNLPPTTANVRVGIMWYDTSFGSKVEQFSIIGYAQNSTESVSSTSIVTTTNGILISNKGTLIIQGFDYEVPLNAFDSYFISGASTDYTLISNSIIFHVPELSPGESIELSYELNYSVLYLLPFLIIGLVYLFYYFTRMVSVSREIFDFKSGPNNISFKVVLNISNVSKNNVNRVRVMEPLPPIISDVFDYGTLHGEVKKSEGGSFILWNLGKLKPNENIILSYRMKSKVGYIGELRLDKTIVEVLDAEGKVQSTVATNAIMVDIEPRKERIETED